MFDSFCVTKKAKESNYIGISLNFPIFFVFEARVSSHHFLLMLTRDPVLTRSDGR
jgi:hypothetical protein